MIKWWNRKEGFTLVELLVVIAIIGILATLLILQLGVARQRARDAQRISHVNQIRTALEFYFDANSSYPDTAAGGTLTDVAQYLQGDRLPVDPTTDADYGYVNAGKTQYLLWADLEQKATALNSDLDETLGGQDFSNPAVSEACDDATPGDCIYDVGQVN